MGYAVIAPEPRLAAFVESLWVQEEEPCGGAVEPTTILPAGRAALVLDFGDPFEEVREDGTRVRLAAVLLSAPRTAPVRVAATGRTGLVIVNLRPGGAEAFLGPQGEHAGAFVDASGAFAERETARARTELAERAGRADARALAAAAERLLFSRRPPERPDALVAAAVERIERSGGREAVAEVCAALGVGRRRLARAFERSVGLAPKAFARVVRFQHALRRARGGARGGASWAAVAAASGYHDQAHLAKEFAALSGRSPTALLARIDERELARTFNGADRRATYL